MVTEAIPYAEQVKALHAVLETLKPETLTLPESLLKILPPRPPDYPRTRESFGAHTGLTFDAEGPVEAAAGLTASLLFHPERASRLVEDHARDAKTLGLEEEIEAVLKATWKAPRLSGLEGQTQFTVDDIVLDHLLELAAAGGGAGMSAGAAFPAGVSVAGGGGRGAASGEARAIALAAAVGLESWLKTQAGSSEAAAHFAAGIAEIEEFRRDPAKFAPAPELATPPGQPIGSDEDGDGW
jgi:hypothetical protein